MLNKNAKPVFADSSDICLVAGKETIDSGLTDVTSPDSVGIASIARTGVGTYDVTLSEPAHDILDINLVMHDATGTPTGIERVVVDSFSSIASTVQSKSAFGITLLDSTGAAADVAADGILSFSMVTKSRDVKF